MRVETRWCAERADPPRPVPHGDYKRLPSLTRSLPGSAVCQARESHDDGRVILIRPMRNSARESGGWPARVRLGPFLASSKLILVAAWVFLTSILASPSQSSEPSPVEVLQPLDTGNVIWLSPVTYFGYFNWRHPGHPVAFTCSSNVVTRHDGQPSNMNIAAMAGFKVQLLSKDERHEEYLFGDTLRVVLDVSSIDAFHTSWPRDALVGATVECILVNGAKGYSKGVRYIQLAIKGPKPIRKYARVYGVWKYRCGPTRTQFY